MRLLLVHNYYQIPGGEDELFESTRALLRAHGHEVSVYVRRNDEIRASSLAKKLTLPLRTTWAWDTRREFVRVLRETRPVLVQFFNTFPLISPAVYGACREAGAVVVQSLDNPRLICPVGSFFRAGKFCQECSGRTPWPAVLHACYRNSRPQSAAVAAMIVTHRALGTWQTAVDAYVVATEFYIRKFVAAGLPADKMHLRRHFIEPDPGLGPGRGDYALFMGRLAPEKGVTTLLEAWQELAIPLKIRGAGPLENEVRAFAATHPQVELLPRLARDEKISLIKGARFLVWPSQGWYETFGLVVAEAFACGVPVIASNAGIAGEMVAENRTGLFFAAGDAAELAAQVRWAWEHPDETAAMGRHARADFEARFTAAAGYRALMAAYQAALALPPTAEAPAVPAASARRGA